MADKRKSELLNSFSVLDLPEPVRSESLAALGMTEDEFAMNMRGHHSCIADRTELALASGDAVEMHYGDDVPAVQVGGKGKKISANPKQGD